jgi:two-component system NtrC family response regulator
MSEKTRRLLIVEDDPSLQKQICWAFDQYEPLAAADREAPSRSCAATRRPW